MGWPEHRPSWHFCYQKQLFINKSCCKSDQNLQWGKFGQKFSTDSQTDRSWALSNVKISMGSHGQLSIELKMWFKNVFLLNRF